MSNDIYKDFPKLDETKFKMPSNIEDYDFEDFCDS